MAMPLLLVLPNGPKAISRDGQFMPGDFSLGVVCVCVLILGNQTIDIRGTKQLGMKSPIICKITCL